MHGAKSVFSPVFSRDDAPVVPTQIPGLHPDLGLVPLGWLGGSGAEDAGEEVQGHRGAVADRKRLHQRPTDVCRGDHRATAEETGKKTTTTKTEMQQNATM